MTIKAIFVTFQLVLLFAFFSDVQSYCPSPLIADGSSTIAPPVLDTQTTGFSANPSSSSANDARLLNIGLQWSTVFNRKIVYVGFGSATTDCAIQNPAKVRMDNSSSSCLTFVTATYVWPLTLYGACQPLFSNSQSDASAERLSVSLIVKYEETYNVSRAGNLFTFKKTIESSLPLVFSFPKTIEVATSAGDARKKPALSIQDMEDPEETEEDE